MTDLNKLRSEFEALPLIKEKLNAVYFDESLNSYFAAMINSSPTVKYVQGAWMAWQEKAKAQAVPEGYVLMPKVPTEKMFQAYERSSVAPMSTLSKTGYKAMVEASESGAEG